jgi:2-polyprenyl-3-methyl-5-hydroxy-6-metoxy-1,4-benzoquinol methylase
MPRATVEARREGCPVCASRDTVIDSKITYGPAGLWHCHSCRSEFLSPQPTDERLAAIYSADYYEPWKVESPERLRRMKELTFRPLIDRVRMRRPSTVLDLGCATGELLGMLDDADVRLFGVDLNPRAIERTRERLPKASLHAGTLHDDPFPDETFDVVTMVDFIEHVRDPVEELSIVAKRLSPNGVIIMSTPRVDSAVRRMTGHSWPQYREEHLTYFSKAGMAIVLGAAGLAISELIATRKAVTPAYIYGQATALPIPVVTPVIEAAYTHLPLQRLGPYRMWFGEMTVVAKLATDPDPHPDESRDAPD